MIAPIEERNGDCTSLKATDNERNCTGQEGMIMMIFCVTVYYGRGFEYAFYDVAKKN